MDIVTEKDIADEILQGRVTAGHLAMANDAISRLARTYGVDPEEITPSPLLKRYGMVSTCKACCLDLVGTDSTVQMDGQRADDIFERKYKLYAELEKDLAKDLTKSDFTTDTETGESPWLKTVNIYRG